VSACVGLLYGLRRRVAAEVGAWVAVAILAVLSLQWLGYSLEQRRLARIEVVAGVPHDDRWLRLD
jgi:hypothetical protein